MKAKMIIDFEIDNNGNIQSYNCHLDGDVQIYSLIGVLHSIQDIYLKKTLSITDTK